MNPFLRLYPSTRYIYLPFSGQRSPNWGRSNPNEGEATPFLTNFPIFYGRAQTNGPNSPDFAKSANFLALNSELGEKNLGSGDPGAGTNAMGGGGS